MIEFSDQLSQIIGS